MRFQERKELERILESLSGRYEKDTAHIREYYKALREIERLVNADMIEPDDGRQLAASAKQVYDEASAAIAAQKKEQQFLDEVNGNRLTGFVMGLIFLLLGVSIGFALLL